jgi:hypothetical protein
MLLLWGPPPAQLANVLSTESLFYACILPFIAFFGSFAFFMYPLRDVLHPTGAPAAISISPCRAGLTLALNRVPAGAPAGAAREHGM